MKTLLLGIMAFLFACTASADPTTNVARVSNISGAVTYSPSGVNTWAYAKLNHTMITGDRLWVDANARAELQMGSAAIRLWSNTYLSILNFNNQTSQFQLNQGSINLHIRKMKANQVYEIDTPNLAFTIIEPGDYRLDVDANKTTTISIRSGQGTVYDSKNASYPLTAKQSYIFSGKDLSQYKTFPLAVSDDFDKWCESRDGYVKKSVSAKKYVSSDVIGSEDLDTYGDWQSNDSYGNVWVPSQVPPGWAPYSSGSWVWVDQYGWTWVDNAPWGFAPYHYGRWVYFRDHWGWVPGPVEQVPVYAPALVVFIAGSNFMITISSGGMAPGIAWFPLGPNDVYIPPYPYSNTYFNNINTSNTVINNTVINNIYNNPNQVINYSNRIAPAAISAMPINSFVNSNPVISGVKLPPNISKLPVKPVAPLSPTISSLTGSTTPVKIKPSPQIINQAVISKTTPPTIVPFDVKKSKLDNNPGVPLAPEITPNKTPAVNNIPHPWGVIIKPEHQGVVTKPEVLPSTSFVPHPPGVIVNPQPHNNIQPEPQGIVRKPEVAPSEVIKPQEHHNIQPVIQPHPQDQQLQQQRAEEQQARAREQQLQQQRAAEQQARMQQMQQQQAAAEQARIQQMQQQQAAAEQHARITPIQPAPQPQHQPQPSPLPEQPKHDDKHKLNDLVE